jgi:hypothetical protein
MTSSYRELFSIECLHGYFSDRLCRVLELTPTPECANMLRRYQMLFRRTAAGGKVLYSVQDGVDRLPLSDETVPFSFSLASTDPLLDTYTDGTAESPAAPRDTVRYFSNRDENVAEVFGQQRLLLHPVGQPFSQPALPVRSHMFTHTFARPLKGARFQVMDNLHGQPVWESKTPEQPVQAWNIDLRAQPPGRYTLAVDGAAVLDFYCSEAPAAKQWGVVEIFAGGPNQVKHIPQACQAIDAAGRAHTRTFTIALDSSKTLWRYYIFDREQGDAADGEYAIVDKRRNGTSAGRDGADGIEFIRQDDPDTLDGRPVIVLQSRQALTLCQYPGDADHQFTLEVKRSDAAPLQIKLPFAQPATTRFVSAESDKEMPAESGKEKRMCSEMFVYF